MSSYEDEDLDDDLPCVSLSQSTGGKSELEMPPASQLASLRAREDAAERALQEHEKYDPLLISLSRSTSQSSTSEEGEAALSAAVSALQVNETRPRTRGMCVERLQLLTSMREHFLEDKFLDSYIEMMKEKPEAVDSVTKQILHSISSALISGRSPDVPAAAAWLLCLGLSSPRALQARRALHAILDVHTSDESVRALAAAVSVAIEDPELLLSAYDSVRTGARRGADQLAATILAHAMARVLAQNCLDRFKDPELLLSAYNAVRTGATRGADQLAATILLAHAMARVLAQKAKIPDSPPSPLSTETVSLVRANWRKLPTRAQLTLLRCAGRALAAGDPGDMGQKGDTEEKRDIRDTDKEEKMDAEDENGLEIEAIETKDHLTVKNTNGIKDASRNSVINIEDRTEPQSKEGGAALLAALAQPLPRAPAFDMNRQQVLTNVSKLQLLFRERFIRELQEKEDIPLNCSQNSLESTTEATPIKTVEINIGTPIKMVTPMKLTYPIFVAKKEIKNEPIKKTVKGQLKLDGFFKQGTQVKVQEDRSPEPKRPKRQCTLKSGKS